jgi:molybdate transport system permease protein
VRVAGRGRAFRRGLLALGYFAATTVALAFLVLPVVAIFVRVSPARLLDQLSNPVVTDALIVSAKTTCIAQLLVLGLGTPTAYLLASRRFSGRSLVVTLVELPLVLPPAVAGIGLLAAFGRFGLLGSTLRWGGISLPFTQSAVTLAVAFVASPLYIRQAIAAFEAIDPNLVAASRTLGAGPTRTFFRVVLPLARGGLAAGGALALARGLGEFGATIMFAGSAERVTQTLPLAIYAEFDVNFDVTLAISGLLVLISAAILISLKLTTLWLWQPSAQTSRSRFALSIWS